MDREKIMQGVQYILEGLGEDPQREGLRDTPRRFAEMAEEILAGIHQEPSLEAGFSEEVADDLIIHPRYSLLFHV